MSCIVSMEHQVMKMGLCLTFMISFDAYHVCTSLANNDSSMFVHFLNMTVKDIDK